MPSEVVHKAPTSVRFWARRLGPQRQYQLGFDGTIGVLTLKRTETRHIESASQDSSALVGWRLRLAFIYSVITLYQVRSGMFSACSFAKIVPEALNVHRINEVLVGESSDLPVVSPPYWILGFYNLRTLTGRGMPKAYEKRRAS